MSETSTLITLLIIGAFLFVMTWSYNDWVSKNPELVGNVPNCEVSSDGKTVECTEDFGTDLRTDQFAWYNLIWVIPFGIAILYAWIPFVKGG